MILADTNVWIDHLRRADPELVRLLENDEVLMHPWIQGELSLGSIHDRTGFIEYLGYLPKLSPVTDADILELIESASLHARGIGWVDAGILAACKAYPCRLWTKDVRLAGIALELGIAWKVR